MGDPKAENHGKHAGASGNCHLDLTACSLTGSASPCSEQEQRQTKDHDKKHESRVREGIVREPVTEVHDEAAEQHEKQPAAEKGLCFGKQPVPPSPRLSEVRASVLRVKVAVNMYAILGRSEQEYGKSELRAEFP